MSSVQAWVSEHKIASVGTLFASAFGASLAYARRKAPLFKPGARPLHARRHVQVLALAVVTGAALKRYYDVTDCVLEPDVAAPASVPGDFFDPVADW